MKADAQLDDLKRLWSVADAVRGSMSVGAFQQRMLGLVLLREAERAFDQRRAFLLAATQDPASPCYVPGAEARRHLVDSRDEYAGVGVLWVPPSARWTKLAERAHEPNAGHGLDAAMDALEAENPELRGALPRGYAEVSRDQPSVALMIAAVDAVARDPEASGDDALAETFDLLLDRFSAAAGHRGADHLTSRSVAALVVRMMEPLAGVVYDPCCGNGGLLAAATLQARRGDAVDEAITVIGQEISAEAWGVARMSMAVRQANADLGDRPAHTFSDDLHEHVRADRIVTQPPFNHGGWGADQLEWDPRWAFGTPPARNANFAWLQHVVHHLAPDGRAAVVLANSSLFSTTRSERQIRSGLVSAQLVECIVALPPALFASTAIPASLWILAKEPAPPHRAGATLFIDASELGHPVSRTRNVLPEDAIARIERVYHAWRVGSDAADYADQAGFCRSVALAEIADNEFALAPGRYVGSALSEPDGQLLTVLDQLVTEWQEARHEGARLDEEIRRALEQLQHD